ncbi:acyl-CoA thioesterase [Sphingopyxis sp. YF1]|jgi:acyl-CoA thioester hydrolase|uniref:acyl-CoA thioesterase n=1 Tax=Sphingopyxis sp. YF1 TaxID=2482763 RepID=UPI001F624980|nr:thioesterase family protein [Sphingopyxis sp. YF1]UNU44234.1 acyl-CoA thioesterase [Sphingopyxis sp. YF1]
MTSPRSEVPLGDFRVHETVRVRFNEIDGQNIVFNGHYLVYADIGVTEYFRALGEGQPGPYFHQYGTDIRETHCEIDYHAPARLDELITIAARVSRFGRDSFTLHCGIFRGEERLTDIEIDYAHLDLDSGQPTPLPGSFIAEVRRFEKRTPIQA